MQKTKRIKVVFDTNVWISFILGGKSNIIRDIILDKRVEIYTSDELTAELFETLKEKKFAKSLIDDKFYQIRLLFSESVINENPKKKSRYCRDPKDDFLFDLALIIKADFLVTGDRDLLESDQKQELRVISPSAFHKILFQ
jgi:uncharacterized protein